MSVGYAGCARLEAQDEKTAIYSYAGENFNLRGKKLVEKRIVRFPNIGVVIADGGIVIDELCGIDEAGCTYQNGVCIVLLIRVFEKYQETGALPGMTAFIA